MAATPSTMLDLGTTAPSFSLPNIDGSIKTFNDIEAGEGTVVMFICNHCPYVIHVINRIAEIARTYQDKGVGFVAISSNDVQNYPQDGPVEMKKFAEYYDLPFAYLYDESQEVAKAYKAACTPDFYVFDKNSKLVYRGRMDASRPGNDIPVTGAELINALENLLSNTEQVENQIPSIGCNIKWKKGNEPQYF